MMRSGRGKAFLAAALIVLVGVVLYMRGRASSGSENAGPQKMVPLVSVAPVQLGSLARTIEITGTVEPEDAVNIVPKIEQRIVWMPLKEGASVARGQVLIRLDSAESADQLAAAQAEVSVAAARLRDVLSGSRPQEIRAARAALAQAQSNSLQAKRDLEHTKKLYGASGIPEQQSDEAQSKYDTALANVEAAKATALDAETELGRQKKMLEIGGVSQEDVDKAQTRCDVSKSALNSANSALRSAKSNLAHVQDLNVKVIPVQKLDEAQARYASAVSAVESAKARLDLLTEGASATQVSVAREQVRQASLKAQTLRTQAGYAVISSPVSGIITRMYMSQGDLAQTKQPLMSISVSGRMIVKAAVTDREAASIRPGTPAILQTPGTPPLRLKVTRVYPSADSVSRLVPVEVALPASTKLAQGAFARVSLVLQKRDNIIVIPADALVQKAGGKSVAFVVRQGKVSAMPVETGIESKGKVEVVSGLVPGDTLVVRGQEMLKDGADVKVKPAKKTPGGAPTGSAKPDGPAQGAMTGGAR